MKIFHICLAMMVTAAIVLHSCAPDQVDPKGKKPNAQASWAEDAQHNLLGAICGNTMSLNMAQPGGGTAVDYCGSANNNPLPCNPNQPNWGAGVIANMRSNQGDNFVVVDMTLTPSWFISNCVAKVADPENFNFDQNGIPIIDASWEETQINPVLNRWAMSWDLGQNSSSACMAIAVKVTVAKLNFFFPTPDPLSVRELWLFNPDFNNQATPNMISPSALLTPWCLQPCPGDVVVVDPRTQCQDFPAIPAPSCTQTVANENVQINGSSAVVCLPNSRNIGSVNFNGAGTLIIEQGATVTGGINANNGGTLIVKGNFNWNSNANINGPFKIYVTETGSLTRSSHLNMNDPNSMLVNLGNLQVGNNMIFKGKVYNSGTLDVERITMNSNSSKLINTGTIDIGNTIIVNNGTRMENCGLIKVGNNLIMNNGSEVKNYCSIIVDNVTFANGNFENFGTLVAGHDGNATGFSVQGPTVLHDNSTILTRNFFWGPGQALEIDGSATILVSNANLNSSNEVTSLSGNGRLRITNNASLSGQGTLTIADINPVSPGDIPFGPAVSFPASLQNLVSTSSNANLVLRALLPQADIPELCD